MPEKTIRKQVSTAKLLSDIRNGKSPRSLTAKQLMRCVGHLWDEKVPVSTIAELLGKSERQISRYRSKLREERALTASPELTGQIAGELWREVELARTRIRALARDPQATITEKIQIECKMVEMLGSMIDRLQCLGYLNPKPAEDPVAGINLQVVHLVATAMASMESSARDDLHGILKDLGLAAPGGPDAPQVAKDYGGSNDCGG